MSFRAAWRKILLTFMLVKETAARRILSLTEMHLCVESIVAWEQRTSKKSSKQISKGQLLCVHFPCWRSDGSNSHSREVGGEGGEMCRSRSLYGDILRGDLNLQSEMSRGPRREAEIKRLPTKHHSASLSVNVSGVLCVGWGGLAC